MWADLRVMKDMIWWLILARCEVDYGNLTMRDKQPSCTCSTPLHWNSITLIWFRMINPPVFFSFTRVIEFWLCLSGPKWTSTWQKWYANLTQFSELQWESACGRMWSRYCFKKPLILSAVFANVVWTEPIMSFQNRGIYWDFHMLIK